MFPLSRLPRASNPRSIENVRKAILSEQKHYLAPTAAAPLQAEVANRFGVLPNFFRRSPQSPEIRASLFCEVRYWISRHVAFGNGRAGGSAD